MDSEDYWGGPNVLTTMFPAPAQKYGIKEAASLELPFHVPVAHLIKYDLTEFFIL